MTNIKKLNNEDLINVTGGSGDESEEFKDIECNCSKCGSIMHAQYRLFDGINYEFVSAFCEACGFCTDDEEVINKILEESDRRMSNRVGETK